MDKIQQILGENKTKESVNSDFSVKLTLPHSNGLLPTNEISKILDLGVQFNKERQESTYYRLFGRINPIVSNPLFNINGINTWEHLNNKLFMSEDVETFADSIKHNLKEIDGWFGFLNPVKGSSVCNFIDMEPVRERFFFNKDINNDTMNWDLTITYPSSSDNDHYLVKNGLLVIDKKLVRVGGKKMVAIATPVLHNLSVGSQIKLSGVAASGVYEVMRLGLDNGDLKDYYFCIEADENRIVINTDSRITRVVNGNPSKYYFRKFKKVKTRSSDIIENDDYEISSLAFSENIFTDNVVQFSFNEDIDVSDLKDNLGRPISELYLTKIKTDSRGIFTRVSSGLEMPFLPVMASNINYLVKVPTIQRIHNGGEIPFKSSIPLEESVSINQNDFYGDLVEYNSYEVKETILSDVQHRFNTIDRETKGNAIVKGQRQEGYYYKAHDLIRIKNFSSYVEQGNKTTTGMPEYKEDLGDGRFLWRDVLDIGFNDGQEHIVNYPFLNGCHYIYQNYTVHVRRQDPFDNWGLYFSDFPSDPIGNTLNNKAKIKTQTNDC